MDQIRDEGRLFYLEIWIGNRKAERLAKKGVILFSELVGDLVPP